MNVSFDDIQARESRHVLQTYKRQPVVFVRGSGSRLYDNTGRVHSFPTRRSSDRKSVV